MHFKIQTSGGRTFGQRFGGCLLFTVVVFALCTALSFLLLLPHEPLVRSFMAFLSELLDQKQIFQNGELSWPFIFLNNLQAVTLCVLSGLVPFLSLPVFTLLFNAVVMGLVSAAWIQSGHGMTSLLAGLLPHGIFELPALFAGIALGLLLCFSLSLSVLGKRARGSFEKDFFRVLRLYLFGILPALLVASWLEAHVTPALLKLFMG